MSEQRELAKLDAMAQAELVRKGKISPVELVEAAIERIERVNPELNAVITPLYEKALEAAAGHLPNGPFKGVPFLLKDLDVVSVGDPYHCGMKLLRDQNWVADHDSYLVGKIRQAGFVILGKTNCPELGLTVTTEPESYGPTRNPWDLLRSTGGSSGGSAAAVASGMVPAAHASDGGGSIRVPSSECGVVGLKPSRGRVSAGPDLGEWWHGLVTSGCVSRTIRDTAAILDVISGYMPGDPYVAPALPRPLLEEVGADPGKLRIGLMTSFPGQGGMLHPDCIMAVQETGRALESLGHTIEDSYPVALDERNEHFVSIVVSWVTTTLDEWRQALNRDIGPQDIEAWTWVFGEMGRKVPASEYLQAMIWVHRFARRMAAWYEQGFDLLITPTISAPPPFLGELSVTHRSTPEELNDVLDKVLKLTPFSSPFNMSGQPSMSLPLYHSEEGLPIGVQLNGPYGREDLLIRIASQLEKVMPWADRWPPASC